MDHKGDHFDVLVIGAGPTGMACAIEAQRAGFTAAMVDKGCLVNSLFHYPANMRFLPRRSCWRLATSRLTQPTRNPTARKRWNITATWPSITGLTSASTSAWPRHRL